MLCTTIKFVAADFTEKNCYMHYSCMYITEWANFGCNATNICTMGTNLNMLKFSLIVPEWINQRVLGNFSLNPKSLLTVSSQGQKRDALFNLSKDQLATVCKFVSELEPSSFGTKMFSIKLSRSSFTDQVCTCFESLLGILKPTKIG